MHVASRDRRLGLLIESKSVFIWIMQTSDHMVHSRNRQETQETRQNKYMEKAKHSYAENDRKRNAKIQQEISYNERTEWSAVYN